MDASATQNRASAKSGQDTGASTDTLTEKGEVVKQKFSFDDEGYLLAVRAGHLDAAQEMVDEAAQKTGYTIRAYHGTAQEFNVFNGGAFFRRLS